MHMTLPTYWGSIFSAASIGGHGSDTRYEQTSTATLLDGRIVMTWQELSSSANGSNEGTRIRAQILNTDGTPDGETFTVNDVTDGRFGKPHVVALAGGDFAIVYDQFNGPAQVNLFAHTFHADGSSIKESL